MCVVSTSPMLGDIKESYSPREGQPGWCGSEPRHISGSNPVGPAWTHSAQVVVFSELGRGGGGSLLGVASVLRIGLPSLLKHKALG